MSKTERRLQRDKLPKVHKPASSRRQQYKDEIEEGLEEWEGTPMLGKAMRLTFPMGTTTAVDGSGTSHDS